MAFRVNRKLPQVEKARALRQAEAAHLRALAARRRADQESLRIRWDAEREGLAHGDKVEGPRE